MRSGSKIASVAILVAALTVGNAAPLLAKTQILFNQFPPPKFIIATGIIFPWVKDLNEALKPEGVTFKVPAKNLAAPPRQMDIVSQGIADGAFIFNAFLSNNVPHLRFSIMPQMSVSSEADGVALWRTYQKHFAVKEPFKTVQLISFFGGPGGDIFSMKDQPIRTIESLKKAKLWSLPFALAQTLKQLGVAVVPGPAARIYPIVSKGTVDGYVGLAMSAAIGFKVLQFAKSVTHVDGYVFAPTFSVFLNKKKWEKLPASAREKIMKLSGESLARRARTWDDLDRKSLATYKASGKPYYPADASLNAAIKRISASMLAGWIKQMEGLGVDGKAALALYRATQKEVEAEAMKR